MCLERKTEGFWYFTMQVLSKEIVLHFKCLFRSASYFALSF